MSDLEIPVLYAKWKVNVRNKSDETIYSSSFLFQGSQWKFRYQFSYDYHHLTVDRENHDDDRIFVPHVITVHVVSGSTGTILPQLSNTERVEYYPYLFYLWSKQDSDIHRTDPSFRETFDLNFLVVLKMDDALTTNISTETQSEERSSTSTSVQTLLNVPSLDSLSQDFSKLLQDQDSEPDFVFQCADYSTKAHRLIVSARSPVIASMLTSDMVENKTGVVNIKDMDLDIFKQFLRYLYSGQLDKLTFDTAVSLYEAGDQYAVLGLSKQCSTFLMEELSVENACDVLMVADAHSDADFVETIIVFMLDKRVPLSGDRWRALCKGHPLVASQIVNRYVEKLLI